MYVCVCMCMYVYVCVCVHARVLAHDMSLICPKIDRRVRKQFSQEKDVQTEE